jgi:hypothetical protein
MFLCDERRTCIKSKERCNGKFECPDLSDELPKYCGTVLLLTFVKTCLSMQEQYYTVFAMALNHKNWLDICLKVSSLSP